MPKLKYEYHGLGRSSLYAVWQHMKNRCYVETSEDYSRYGARGITMCDRWKNSFMAFHIDMGDIPFKGAQLDREDNDGDYTPDNCRWVTRLVNIRNSTVTKLNEAYVRMMRQLYKTGLFSYADLSKLYNISKPHVSNIINNKKWVLT